MKLRKQVTPRYPHGVRQRYQGSRTVPPCRCDECKAANNLYMRDRRRAIESLEDAAWREW